MQTLGYIVIAVGVLWFYLVVLRESPGWFLACLLFPPAWFLFWIQHLRLVKGPTVTWIAGAVLIVAGGYTPAVRDGRFRGTWTGTTEEGQVIAFQVASDAPSNLFPLVLGERGISESAYDISASVQFDSSCPLGHVFFSSRQSALSSAHIFENPGSSYFFRVLNMQTPGAVASIEGEFTSPDTASGTIRVVDYRADLQERFDHPCPFETTVGWTATKVQPGQ